MIDAKIQKDLIHQKKEEFDEVPNMDQILQDKKLKIVVKMNNMMFSSIKDIFQNSSIERFLTAQEKRDLQNKKKKEMAMIAKFKK